MVRGGGGGGGGGGGACVCGWVGGVHVCWESACGGRDGACLEDAGGGGGCMCVGSVDVVGGMMHVWGEVLYM